MDQFLTDGVTVTFYVFDQGLQLLQSPRGTSVTRRAAGLPMLFLSVVSAAETNQGRSLLSISINTLLEVANRPLPDNWDQTVDLPQVIFFM